MMGTHQNRHHRLNEDDDDKNVRERDFANNT